MKYISINNSLHTWSLRTFNDIMTKRSTNVILYMLNKIILPLFYWFFLLLLFFFLTYVFSRLWIENWTNLLSYTILMINFWIKNELRCGKKFATPRIRLHCNFWAIFTRSCITTQTFVISFRSFSSDHLFRIIFYVDLFIMFYLVLTHSST